MLWKAEREKFQGFAWKPHHISFFHGHRTISLGGQPKAALSTCPSCHSYLPTKEWHILCCSREANTFADYKITPFTGSDRRHWISREKGWFTEESTAGLGGKGLRHSWVISLCLCPLPVEGEAGIKGKSAASHIRRTKQAAKGVCSDFMSSASIPATEVKFINSCEALSTGGGNISAPNRHFWSSLHPVTAKHWPTALGYFFDTKQQI